MPELPEVETMVRGVRSAFVGGRLIAVARCRCPCRPIDVLPPIRQMAQRSVGKLVSAVRRRGKRIIVELTGGDAFVVEPRMTGLMLLADPPDQKHLRLCWTVEHARGVQHVWYWDRRGLGRVCLLSPQEQLEMLGPKHLGPDALELSPRGWRERLKSTSREVKVALLDQKLVAGIGNLYASEILHVAGIHPSAPSDRLTGRQVQKLFEAVQLVLEEAILHEGSTLSDGTYRNALNEAGGYQNKHRVYAREGAVCGTCTASRIRRTVQAQRSTFFCSRCQRRGSTS